MLAQLVFAKIFPEFYQTFSSMHVMCMLLSTYFHLFLRHVHNVAKVFVCFFVFVFALKHCIVV